MKRILLIVSLLFWLGIVSVYSQYFEGKLVYGSKVTGAMAEQLSGMMPSQYIWYFKDGKYLMEIKGGMAGSVMNKMLYNGGNKAYLINDAGKTAYEIDITKDAEEKPDIKIEDLGKYETISGYKCKKYKVTINSMRGTQIVWLWVTDRIKVKPPKNPNVGQGFMYEGITGFPLKTITELKDMEVNIITEIKEIKETKLDDSIFQVPKGYKIKSYEEFMKQLGGY